MGPVNDDQDILSEPVGSADRRPRLTVKLRLFWLDPNLGSHLGTRVWIHTNTVTHAHNTMAFDSSDLFYHIENKIWKARANNRAHFFLFRWP
jgi:hypothetical protein